MVSPSVGLGINTRFRPKALEFAPRPTGALSPEHPLQAAAADRMDAAVDLTPVAADAAEQFASRSFVVVVCSHRSAPGRTAQEESKKQSRHYARPRVLLDQLQRVVDQVVGRGLADLAQTTHGPTPGQAVQSPRLLQSGLCAANGLLLLRSAFWLGRRVARLCGRLAFRVVSHNTPRSRVSPRQTYLIDCAEANATPLLWVAFWRFLRHGRVNIHRLCVRILG